MALLMPNGVQNNVLANGSKRKFKSTRRQMPKRVLDITVSLVLLPFYWVSRVTRTICGLLKSKNSRHCYEVAHTIDYRDQQGNHQQLTLKRLHQEPAIEHIEDFQRLSFTSWGALIFTVLSGRLSWVGPCPLRHNDEEAQWSNIKPGVFNGHTLRLAANIAHHPKNLSELEYILDRSISTDVTIILRSLLSLLVAGQRKTPSQQLTILDVSINNVTMQEATDLIEQAACQTHTSTPCHQVSFVNPDCLNIAYRNTYYQQTLSQADTVIADGIGIHIASRLLGVAMADNVNGTDLFPFICERAANQRQAIYLLGGRPGVVETMRDVLIRKYPDLVIAGYRDGFFDETETNAVINDINHSGASILFVAMGVPKQDIWIAKHKHQLRVGVALGVGGLFDFISGRIPRAPIWMRECGLEWVYRLVQEPGRMWRRYVLGNPLFLYRVWCSKSKSKTPLSASQQ